MRVFFVRHGETVDNVAGRLAGTRDSALTSHGVLQAQRLAEHLAPYARLTHIYSSDLQRAARTAEAISVEQKREHGGDGLGVVQLAVLREKNFGSAEGEGFRAKSRSAGRKRTARINAETERSMKARMLRFVHHELLPLFGQQPDAECVVVAHGIILGVLFKMLCTRIPRSRITLEPGVSGFGWNPAVLEPVVAFLDNSGFIECTISPVPTEAAPTLADENSVPLWGLHIQQINSTSHLRDLKKTRGGIGSSAHDSKQRTLTSFFATPSKKRTVENMANG